MYKLASCEYEECASKDICERYKNDTAIINFKFYYNETKNKCEYYIEKERLEDTQNEKEDKKENGESEQSTEQRE